MHLTTKFQYTETNFSISVFVILTFSCTLDKVLRNQWGALGRDLARCSCLFCDRFLDELSQGSAENFNNLVHPEQRAVENLRNTSTVRRIKLHNLVELINRDSKFNPIVCNAITVCF